MRVRYIDDNFSFITIDVKSVLFQIKSDPCCMSNTFKSNAWGNIQYNKFNDLPCEYWVTYIKRR